MTIYANRAPARQARGFTLIELMIVVVIIGVMAAIALPNYMEHIRKGRRVDAKTALLDVAAREEKYFAINNQYATLSQLGLSNGIKYGSSSTVYYQLTEITLTTSASNPGFSVKAVPTTAGRQNTDKCGTYTLNNRGVQGNEGATDTACW